MHLVVNPPIAPMLSRRGEIIPRGPEWIFEPKWDGFRAMVFRDNDEILIQSRDQRSLNRYFPELLESLASQLPGRWVLDGEIVIARDGRLDFEALQLRIHPAASRVRLLSRENPASIVFFDMLCRDDRDLRQEPFATRRKELESLLCSAEPPLHITPATRDVAVASDWFRRFEGAGLDGVMAKSVSARYEPGKRVMLKIKHERECDCVVAGFRWHKDEQNRGVGSLLLGLFDDAGALQHVGVCASFSQRDRRDLVEHLAPYRRDAPIGHPWKDQTAPEASAADGNHRMPGSQSRWSRGKDLSWEPLRPELVVEVAYDHMQGGRFRHTAHFRRWRLDKGAADCSYAQLDVAPPEELKTIFCASRRGAD